MLSELVESGKLEAESKTASSELSFPNWLTTSESRERLRKSFPSTCNFPLSADSHPCFCLCFVFVQITRTIPFRRTILQFSQIRRTLLRTFMVHFPLKRRLH